MAENPQNLRLSEVEQRISERYVMATHLKAIGLAAQKMNFAISFRLCGEPTIKRQKQGAATKGHDNLEKTIKVDSLRGGYGEKALEVFGRLEGADIDGYAGHWDNKKLIGIHLGPEALEDTELKKHVRFADVDKSGHGEKPYYPIDMDNLEESLAALKSRPNWHAIPVTGDDDAHDLISFTGQRGAVPQGTDHEAKIIAAINDAVAAIDPQRPAHKQHKRVVQHGPQQNFIAFEKNNEEGESLVEAVARPSYPLAMCCRGVWTEILNETQHRKFFEDNRLKMKVTWERPDEHLVSVGDGLVAFRRSSSSSLAASLSSTNSRDQPATLALNDIAEGSEENTDRTEDPQQSYLDHR